MTQAALARKAELEEALARIVKNLVDRYRPKCIILFGSLARGECGEWSDLDLCVIQETPLPFYRRAAAALEAAEEPVAMDIFVYTPSEWSQMVREGNCTMVEEIRAGKVLYGHPD